MFADEDENSAAVKYLSKILYEDVLQIKILVSRLNRAPAPARRYLQRHCRNARELEEFLADNPHAFFVENGRVALHRDQFERSRNEAVWYFKEKLEGYDEPVHFERLKKDHLGGAPEEVADFIVCFYPLKEFKSFLRSRPDVFVVYPDNTVFLIETETLAFYERSLERCPEKKLPFLHLRGHVGQAPRHVQHYVNRYYLGDDFQIFLRNHSDVFVLDDELNVSLVPFQ